MRRPEDVTQFDAVDRALVTGVRADR